MSASKELLQKRLLDRLSKSFKESEVKSIIEKYGKPIAFKTVYTQKALTVNDESRSFEAIASVESPDRVSDVLHADGWVLKDFLKNNVLLWCHQYSELPIGKCNNLRIENKSLLFAPTFVPADIYPYADTVYRMYKEGYLNAFSVGFDPVEWTFNEETMGFEFYKQALLEISCVPVPMHPDALAKKTVQEYLAKAHGTKICTKCSSGAHAPAVSKPEDTKSIENLINEKFADLGKQIQSALADKPAAKSETVDLSGKISEMKSILCKQG